jgi:predicted dithiol-disulfide oxidoreductase (DUF899 family)
LRLSRDGELTPFRPTRLPPNSALPTAPREEWLAERLELLEAEKALTRAGDEFARRRRELPWVRVEKAWPFDTDQGEVSRRASFV